MPCPYFLLPLPSPLCIQQFIFYIGEHVSVKNPSFVSGDRFMVTYYFNLNKIKRTYNEVKSMKVVSHSVMSNSVSPRL